MRKIITLALALCAFGSISYAEVVGESRAREVAARFFYGNFATKADAQRLSLVWDGTDRLSDTKSSSSDDFEFITPSFYTYNRLGGGFVFISGDDSVDPIIGYSETGSINPDDMPPALVWWLDGIKKTIDSKRTAQSVPSFETAYNWNNITKAVGEGSYYYGEGGKQLDTPQWDQGTPFNDNVPRGCPCGCVATAMTELMRFYSHPSEPLDAIIPGYTDNSNHIIGDRDLTERIYDWENMPLTISGCQNAGSEVKNNIADLLADVGASVNMSYSSNGSGTYSEHIVYSMGHYFHYNKQAYIAYRDNYTQKEWIDMMVQSIDDGHPLLTGGVSEDGGGHQFIVDGYDGNHYMRFNFGWGTYYNGYWAVGMNEFALEFSAIFDLYPDETGESEFEDPKLHFSPYGDYQGLALSSGRIEKGNSFTLKCGTFVTDGPADFNGYLRLALVDKDGVDTTGLGSLASCSLKIGYYGYGNISGRINSDLKLGDHIILQSAVSSSGPWSQVKPIANGILVGEYPCSPYAFIDLPETCNVGDEFELRLKNAPYIWYDKTKWYITEPGDDTGTLVSKFTQGALNDTHRPSYKFTQAGIYTVRVSVTGQETISARIEVK